MITTILAVCSANQCRSPYMEFALRQTLRQLSPNSAVQPTISSAGTMAKNGLPIHPSTARTVKKNLDFGDGVDDTKLPKFSSTYLTPALAKKQDLILCATDAHRRDVVKRTPAVARRTFVVGKLAEVLRTHMEPEQTEPDLALDFATLGTLINNLPGAADAYDCADPVGKSEEFFDSTAAQLTRDISVISKWITAVNNL